MPRRAPRRQLSLEVASQRLAERIELGRALLTRAKSKVLEARDEFSKLRSDCTKWQDYNYTMLRTMFDVNEVAFTYWNSMRPNISALSHLNRPLVVESLHLQLQCLVTILEQLHLYQPAKAGPESSDFDQTPSRGVSISIQGSTIGTFNLGEVLGNIQTHVGAVIGPSVEPFRAAITRVAQAVAQDSALVDRQQAILEHLDHLVDLAELPAERRKLSVVRSILATIETSLRVGVYAPHVLANCKPDLMKFFGI